MDSISRALLILIVSLVLHLVEEIKMGLRKRFPLGEMPAALFVGINCCKLSSEKIYLPKKLSVYICENP